MTTAANPGGELLLFLLVAVILFAGLARLVRIPYPILLMVAGVGLSFVPHVPRLQLPPALVFSLFLPPLLYSAAWTLSWREFQRNFALIGMLAFGLVIVTILGLMAAAGTLLPGFTWQSALLLGAVVAATDAIAATSVARRVGLPHSIVSLLEAESLVNDGTALLALQFGLGILLTGHVPTFAEGVGHLVFLTGGGVLVGLAIAVPLAWVERYIDDGPIEIVLGVLLPYLAWLAAEHAHVSGVIAVISCGMYMSRQSYTYLSAEVRLQSTAVWDALAFVLNGLIFVLLGLQMPFVLDEVRRTHVGSVWLYGALFSAALIAVRVLWIFAERHIAHLLRRFVLRRDSTAPAAAQLTVIGWGGMRGVLSLAAAVSLPLTTPNGPFRERPLIIFLAFYLIVVTLVFQGLTLPALIRRLGLAGHAELRLEEQEARRTILREALAYLRRDNASGDGTTRDLLIQTYQSRLDALPSQHTAAEHGTAPQAPGITGPGTREERLASIVDVLHVQKSALLRLRDNGEIDDEVLRTLQRELDLAESRFLTAVV